MYVDPHDPTMVRDVFVDQARARALSTPQLRSSLENEELRWSRNNPAGRVDWLADDHVSLWNFGVASAGIKPEHIEGLRRLVGSTHINGPGYTGTFIVAGHASTSGAAAENQKLATARAAAVAAWLRAAGFPHVFADGQGEDIHPAPDGQGLAQARRVEVLREDPAATIPVVPELSPPVPAAPSVAPSGPPSGVPNPRVGFAVDFWFPPFTTTHFIAQYGIQGVARQVGTLPPAAGTVSTDYRFGRGAASIDYQKEIVGALRGKLGLETPGVNRPGWMASAGLQWADLLVLGDTRITPEAGISMNDAFLPGYFTLKFDKLLLDVESIGLRFQASVTLRTRFAPSPALVARAGPLLVAAGVVAFAVAGTALISQSAEWAREAGLDRLRELARRDGMAIRVAAELMPDEATTRVRERLDAYPTGGADPSIVQALIETYTRTSQEFTQLRASGTHAERVAALRATHGSADPSFEGIRQSVFTKLGGYHDQGPPLELRQL